MVGAEKTGPWGGGAVSSAPPLPAVGTKVMEERDQELEQLRERVEGQGREIERLRVEVGQLRVRCRRSEAAASRASDVLRELAPVFHSTLRAVAAATVDAQLHAAEDAGELPF